MSFDLAAQIETNQQRVNRKLKALTNPTVEHEDTASSLQRLQDACHYVVNNGGKRIRPNLVYFAATAISRDTSIEVPLDYTACAIELLHTYSLVHDDLPAMDDDDLRRGEPSCHIAYDEATAILVGDALQTRAFELLATAPDLTAEQQVAMIQTLASAAGAAGMVGGQHIDVCAADTLPSMTQLQTMHELKTGAIICAALALGGIAAGANREQLAALSEFGRHIGLAFQVVDDVLDVTEDSTTLGKTSGKDDESNKPTYVSLLGLEGARKKAQSLLQQALKALEDFGESGEPLRKLAAYIVSRNH